MSKKQEEVKESIRKKTDRELQETIAYFSIENEKHLRNISATISWFFWIFITGIVLCIAGLLLAGGGQAY